MELKAIWGGKAEFLERLGKSTADIERNYVTAHLFNARLTRKTPAFRKRVSTDEAALTREDAYYHWVRPHKDCGVALLENGDAALLGWRLD